MKFRSLMLAAGAIALTAGPATTALAKVEGDTIILGSAISLTGKYATNGLHTQRGYDYAAKIINEAGGVKVGDFLENDGNNIKIIGVGTATFHANFNSGICSDRIFVDGTVPGLDTSTLIINDGVFHSVSAVGGTFFTITPVLATGIATNGIVLMDSFIDENRIFETDHHFVIGLESDVTAAITAGDALQIKRHKGGYSRNVYGVGKTGVEDAEVDGSGAGLYATSAGWVGVTTYIDTDGNLRVKKEVLVAMSGISTGNAPSYPNIEHAN